MIDDVLTPIRERIKASEPHWYDTLLQRVGCLFGKHDYVLTEARGRTAEFPLIYCERCGHAHKVRRNLWI